MLDVTGPINTAGIGVTITTRLDGRGAVMRCDAPASHRQYCALGYRLTQIVIQIINLYQIDCTITCYFYVKFNHNVHVTGLNKMLKLILCTNMGLYKGLLIQLSVDNRNLGTRQPKITGARVAWHLWRRQRSPAGGAGGDR